MSRSWSILLVLPSPLLIEFMGDKSVLWNHVRCDKCDAPTSIETTRTSFKKLKAAVPGVFQIDSLSGQRKIAMLYFKYGKEDCSKLPIFILPFGSSKIRIKRTADRKYIRRLLCINEPVDAESSNSFLLTGNPDDSFLIAAGWSDEVEIPKNLGLWIEKSYKVTTHFHFDHIRQWHKMNNIFLTQQQYQACEEIFCSPSRWQTIFKIAPFQISGKFFEFHPVKFKTRLTLISCDGHSPSDTCFLDEQTRTLFLGDLFYLGLVLHFLQGSNIQKAIETFKRVLTRNDWDRITLRHGDCITDRANLSQYVEDLRKVMQGQLPWAFNFDFWIPLRAYPVSTGYILTHLIL